MKMKMKMSEVIHTYIYTIEDSSFEFREVWIWNLESGMRGLYRVLRVRSFGCRFTLSS